MTKVAIGIQARSGSTRLPGKVHARLGNTTVLQHVIDSCQSAATYLNNWTNNKVFVDVSLLIPRGDMIEKDFKRDVFIIEGSEHDVLSRYVSLLENRDADYICRVTADCPLIPSFVISKMITLAVANAYDYVSNVDERCRTTLDGWDCEVASRRAIEYVDRSEPDLNAREHVTKLLRTNPPKWLKQGCVVNFLDMSDRKLSVDTEEDLQRVTQEFEKVDSAYRKAVSIFGKRQVHRW